MHKFWKFVKSLQNIRKAFVISSVAKKGTDIAKSLGKDFLGEQIDKFNKEYITGKALEITLTNNEIKGIMKGKVFRI